MTCTVNFPAICERTASGEFVQPDLVRKPRREFPDPTHFLQLTLGCHTPVRICVRFMSATVSSIPLASSGEGARPTITACIVVICACVCASYLGWLPL